MYYIDLLCFMFKASSFLFELFCFDHQAPRMSTSCDLALLLSLADDRFCAGEVCFLDTNAIGLLNELLVDIDTRSSPK